MSEIPNEPTLRVGRNDWLEPGNPENAEFIVQGRLLKRGPDGIFENVFEVSQPFVRPEPPQGPLELAGDLLNVHFMRAGSRQTMPPL